MPRPFDAGKTAYGKAHRPHSVGQQTRHILGDDLLQHYGTSECRYADVQKQLGNHAVNYRMGTTSTNGFDTRIDNRLIGTLFTGPQVEVAPKYKTYDATVLARGEDGARKISYKRQGEMLGARFETAKDLYSRTGEHKYYMMARDIRGVADDNLDVDLRQWRMPG